MQTTLQRRVPAADRPGAAWMHGPVVDTVLGWIWLPVAIVVRMVSSDIDTLHLVVGSVFVLSFAHQPLTVGLVYGDPVQRAAHRRLYRFAPFVAAAVIVIGLHVSLGVVALMAGLWNAEHTLMQRYGVMRIYGRKVGETVNRLEKPMLIVWLVAGLSFLGGFVDLDRLVSRLGLGGTNRRSVAMLHSIHGVAVVVFVVAMIAAVVITARWWQGERAQGRTANRAKHVYALGTLGLVAMVMIDPIAGIAGYVAAHAIEYFAIVHTSLRTRRDDSPIAAATRSAPRRAIVYSLYTLGIVAILVVLLDRLDGQFYAFAVLFFGAIHILYDGLVWKLRRPSVASSLGINPVGSQARS